VSIMPVPEIQAELFEIAPFLVEKEVLNLRGSGSFTLTEDVAAELKRINGTEELLALTVYVSCEGLKVLDGDLTWIATLADVVLADS
jgi:hypothetical protein